MEPESTITGTFRTDLKIGEIYINQKIDQWGETSNVTFKVLRESTEQEYRDKYNYRDSLPFDPFLREPKFYEIIALD